VPAGDRRDERDRGDRGEPRRTGAARGPHLHPPRVHDHDLRLRPAQAGADHSRAHDPRPARDADHRAAGQQAADRAPVPRLRPRGPRPTCTARRRGRSTTVTPATSPGSGRPSGTATRTSRTRGRSGTSTTGSTTRPRTPTWGLRRSSTSTTTWSPGSPSRSGCSVVTG
jgi:hypothetical protein